jgi:hypothetical protein
MGATSGINKGMKPFQRHCLVIRGTDRPLEDDGEATQARPTNGGASSQDLRERMFGQTGLFTREKLRGRHRQAIDQLARILPKPIFDDPIFKHPEYIYAASREPEPKSPEINE